VRVGAARAERTPVGVRAGVDRELLVAHRPDDLGQAPVVLGPAIVERSDGHAKSLDAHAVSPRQELWPSRTPRAVHAIAVCANRPAGSDPRRLSTSLARRSSSSSATTHAGGPAPHM